MVAGSRYDFSRLHRVEARARKLGYRIRYGRGNFDYGICRLGSKKVLAINRFLSIEAKTEILEDVVGVGQYSVRDGA